MRPFYPMFRPDIFLLVDLWEFFSDLGSGKGSFLDLFFSF